jgi:DNA-binding LytR/AlgR family response regulator
MKLKCLIVDDEPIAQNIVKGFISDTPKLELFAICDNALEALNILEKNRIDVLFLDIEMPKLSGLSFLKTLPTPPATIITTAYREFALEGYELSVVDYLLKPFSFERFLKAINKVSSINSPESGTSETNPALEYTYFKVDRKNVKVKYDDIFYIQGLSNYVKIHLENDILVVYEKLLDLEKSLPKDKFVRVHKSYIVSLAKIKSYTSDAIEIAEKELSIGNTYRENFFSKIKKQNP